MIPIPKLELSATALKLILAITCVLAVALLVHDRNRWKARAEERGDRLVAEQTVHAGTIANIRAAAEQARRADLANLARVKSEQAAINERISDDFAQRLALARAAAGRMRREGSRPAGGAGAGNGAAMPVAAASPGSASQAAGEDGFPLADRLIATEQAIQLDALIAWVRAQASVDPDGAPNEAR